MSFPKRASLIASNDHLAAEVVRLRASHDRLLAAAKGVLAVYVDWPASHRSEDRLDKFEQVRAAIAEAEKLT